MSNGIVGIASKIMVLAMVISVVLLFIGIAILILIHVCIAGRAFRRGMNASNSEDGGNFGNNGMSADDLERIPSFDFKARAKGSSPVDCVVCLENFKMGEKCRLLPNCNHSFHVHCIDSWLLKTPICPICRKNADFQNGTGENPHPGGAGLELRESPSVVIGIPVSSNPSPMHPTSLE